MLDVFLDALFDSLKVLGVIILIYIFLSFFEEKLSNILTKHKKTSPFIGSALGLIPQCGISVVSADLYIKNHLSMGTIVAIFIACSDEAVPIILSNPNKALSVLPLLLIKFIVGFIVGFMIDLIYRNSKKSVHNHLDNCQHEEEVHVGCCHHEIDNEHESKIKRHIIHPLVHSLKIFLYVFTINFLFGTLIYFIGEDVFIEILQNNKYLTPIYAAIIGLIPNCASSVIITELYLIDGLSFGTTLAGLITNAGLGMVMLLKNKKMIKKAFVIIGILILVALVIGYTTNFITGF